MIHFFVVCALAVSTITAAPQFVTFKDGKIGVNFAGYNAEAGLGGLLTGNAAHGGLSASAGTPFGQRAAAGLDGFLNGNAGGRGYAGAQASDSIGASAILGGSTGPGQRGLLGAEAHSNGNSVTKTISSDTQPQDVLIVPTDLPKNNGVQKVKPPKKYAPTNVENPSILTTKSGEIPAVESVPTEVKGDAQTSPAVFVVKGHHHHRLNKNKHLSTRRRVFTPILYAPILTQRFNNEEEQKPISRTSVPTKLGSSATRPEVQGGNQHHTDTNVELHPGGLNTFFNIPIGILQSIRDNLQPIGVRKQTTYSNY